MNAFVIALCASSYIGIGVGFLLFCTWHDVRNGYYREPDSESILVIITLWPLLFPAYIIEVSLKRFTAFIKNLQPTVANSMAEEIKRHEQKDKIKKKKAKYCAKGGCMYCSMYYQRCPLQLQAANSVKVGAVVITEHCLDIGIVSKVNDRGKPMEIRSRFCVPTGRIEDHGCAVYGGVDGVQWYDTGVCMTMTQWRELSRNTVDAAGFYSYWQKRLGFTTK